MKEGVYCSNCKNFDCNKEGKFICIIDGEILQQDYCHCESYVEYKKGEENE